MSPLEHGVPGPVAAPSTASPVSTAPVAAQERAQRVFSTSVAVSAVRCLLTYVLLPWVAPLLGFRAGVGPGVGLVIGAVAITFNVASIRRFWSARHRWRWPITVINVSIIGLLLVLAARDIATLVS